MRCLASARVRPGGELRQARAVRAAGGVKVADHHVVEQNVVQPARAEFAADQMGVHVQHRHFGQRLLQRV